MIVSKGELKMIKAGRRWLERSKRPRLRVPTVVCLRTSKNALPFTVTVDKVVPYGDRWRLLVRPGDCLEHLKLLAPSTGPGTGVNADLGYTEDYWRAMQDEPEAMV